MLGPQRDESALELTDYDGNARRRTAIYQLLVADPNAPNVPIKNADLIPEKFAISGIGVFPVHNAAERERFKTPSPFLSVQLPVADFGTGAMLLPGATQITEQRRSVGVRDTVAVVRNDDAAEPAETAILKVHADRGGICIKPVPYELSDGSDRLRPRLAFEEIGLNFYGVIGHGRL
jgi:hypothetical protein